VGRHYAFDQSELRTIAIADIARLLSKRRPAPFKVFRRGVCPSSPLKPTPPICTFAANDVNEARLLLASEKDEWTEIGAIPRDATASVRQANAGETLIWKQMRAEAIEDGAVADEQEAADSIIAFHVEVTALDDDAEE
jgi:hypothetical protein